MNRHWFNSFTCSVALKMCEHCQVTSMKWRLHHMGPGCVSLQECIIFLLSSVLFVRNASVFIPECNGMFFLTFRRSSEKNWEGRIIRKAVMLFTGRHSCWQVTFAGRWTSDGENGALPETSGHPRVSVDTHISTNGALADSLELPFHEFYLNDMLGDFRQSSSSFIWFCCRCRSTSISTFPQTSRAVSARPSLITWQTQSSAIS